MTRTCHRTFSRSIRQHLLERSRNQFRLGKMQNVQCVFDICVREVTISSSVPALNLRVRRQFSTKEVSGEDMKEYGREKAVEERLKRSTERECCKSSERGHGNKVSRLEIE